MPHRIPRASAIASLCALACAAQAQPAQSARPDPLDAAASVPAMRHESALRTYKPSGETKPVRWQDANATVERIGGWRAYARDGAASASAPAASEPGVSPPHKH